LRAPGPRLATSLLLDNIAHLFEEVKMWDYETDLAVFGSGGGGMTASLSAQVIKKDGEIIEGLYAVGNTSAFVMGNTYP